jgi:ppGpp synthetase/RelA/SpoT-type nucleotidyltranferase
MKETEIISKFHELEPAYVRLAKAVEEALKHSLLDAGINAVSITSRLKDLESFLEKIKRKSYKEPFKQNTDFAGARVVCLYTSDVYKIQEMIEKEFVVIEKENKAEYLGVNKMGYQGFSYIIKLSKAYSGVYYDGLHDLICEIQLRTATQDTWAIFSHDLLYKREDLIPSQLERAINNVSSLLEIAQGVFDDTQKKRNQYETEIREKSEDVNELLNQPINDATLRAYTEIKFKKLPIKENIHSLILRDINIADYPNLKALDEAINKAKPAVDIYYKEAPELFKSGSDFITKSLGFIDDTFLINHPFCQKTREAVRKLRPLIE